MAQRVKLVYVKRAQAYYMRWLEPDTNIEREKSLGKVDRKQALKLAAQHEADIDAGRYLQPSKVTWEEFRERYEREKLASLAVKTKATAGASLNHVETIIRPARLRDLTAAAISRLQAKLRESGIRETSIATHLRQLRAALNWAHSIGMLPKVPKINPPKRAKGSKMMRGRPITAEEYERMTAAAPLVKKTNGPAWQRYLTGLWLSGLRLQESLALSWDDDAPIWIDLSGKRPRLRILAEAEKGHQDRALPLTPDFATWLFETTPEAERTGRVFKLSERHPEAQLGHIEVSAVVSRIGRKANVVVDKAEDKFATAHDLRRAFGTRWATRVKPVTLQLLMRHRHIETTLRYYVELNADDVADELWKEHSAVANQSQRTNAPTGDLGGKSGGNGPVLTDAPNTTSNVNVDAN